MTTNRPHQSSENAHSVAIVGMGACMPDAPDVATFWQNILKGHVAIGEVPPNRWRKDLYHSDDRTLMDRTYSAIGGFIKYDPFEPKRFRIMPRSLHAIDDVQKLALVAVAEALGHAGYEVFRGDGSGKPFARERCAIIMGNTLGGEFEDRTSLRVWLPEIEAALRDSAQARGQNQASIDAWVSAFHDHYAAQLPIITEDSMTGELPNCITGRIANVFDLCGPNFTTDAACASSMAALSAGVRGLLAHEYDIALVGGADRSMDPPTYVKFSRIGALSPDGSKPFDAKANGFVMGEGAGIVVLRRLEDALANGDTIYSVVRAIGASSDGRGKGMTAPNPRGQRLAIERAWAAAGVPLTTAGLFEAHGTGTPVGDKLESETLTSLLQEAGHTGEAVPIGSVKSMIGHLKSASGVASLIKTTLALHHKILPPSANFTQALPESSLHEGKIAVNTQTRPWTEGPHPRRAGISSFGFGGTNSHVVLEAYAPSSSVQKDASGSTSKTVSISVPKKQPLAAAMTQQVVALFAEHTGYSEDELDLDHHLEADLGIDSIKQAEVLALLRERYGIVEDGALKMSDLSTLRATIAYVSQRAPDVTEKPTTTVPAANTAVAPEDRQDVAPGPRVLAFAGATLDEALQVGAHALAQTLVLSEVAQCTPTALLQAPVRVALVAQDCAEAAKRLADGVGKSPRLLAARGIFTAAGAPLAHHAEMAFIFPGQGSQYLGMLQDLAKVYPVVAETFAEADRILQPLLGNTLSAWVWADPSDTQADAQLRETQICQPAMLTADVALTRLLAQYGIAPQRVAGHSLGEYAAAVAAKVMTFADALYAVSARGREMADVEVEDPGKMAMVACDVGRAQAVLDTAEGYVIAANKNCHTQTVIAGASVVVDDVLAKFAAQGIEARLIPVSHAFHSEIVAPAAQPLRRVLEGLNLSAPALPFSANVHADYYPDGQSDIVALMAKQLASPVQWIDQVERLYQDGVRIFVEVGPKRALTGFVRNILGDREHRALASNHPKKAGVLSFLELLAALTVDGATVPLEGSAQSTETKIQAPGSTVHPVTTEAPDGAGTNQTLTPAKERLVISGMSVAMPNQAAITPLDADPFAALLSGENLISPIADDQRDAIVDLNVTRFDKDGGRFVSIGGRDEVVHLAGQLQEVDLTAYGIEPNIIEALDITGKLAIAMGIDALRDAGLPLVRRMRTTSTGSKLFDRWGLAPSIAERTGVILASAFPGFDAIADEIARRYEAKNANASYAFDRKWIFRALAMGHAQLAQVVMAQGPNSQINAACASGSQAIGMATDWLRADRCDRVIVVTADNITTQASLPWFGAGFLAVGSASIEQDVATAAVPFGRGRNGMILGSGAAAFVVEKEAHVTARGMIPIAEVVAADFANSAFHGTRLDADFIGQFMGRLVGKLNERCATKTSDLAGKLVFMSHETYTPARGGSSAAEIAGLRHVFGDATAQVTIANTKGFTGHPMGASLEDAAVIKGLQRQSFPPVANLADVDPAFADLAFSRGGAIPATAALRFAAGFGSQVAATAYHRRATQEARLVDTAAYRAFCLSMGMAKEGGLQIVERTLRMVDHHGLEPHALGIPALQQPQGEGPYDAAMGEPVVATVQAPTPASQPPMQVAQEAVSSTVPPAEQDTDLLAQLTALFAEQTGYDVADLAPTHALEADLGIDSVKQAEIFALMRERFAMGTDPQFRLSDVQTLEAAVAYVQIWRQDNATSKVAPPARAIHADTAQTTPEKNTPAAQTLDSLIEEIVGLFAQETGYDVADLDPTLALEADLGIDSIKQAELLAQLRERYGMAADPEFRFSEVQTIAALAAYVHQHVSAHIPAGSAPLAQIMPPAAEPARKVQPVAPKATSDHDAMVVELTAIFAEHTGYDAADLSADHGLEADLGIDSVKQAEIFALVRTKFGMAPDPDFRLGEVQTLNALATYVLAWRQGPPTPPQPPQSKPPTPEVHAPQDTSDVPLTATLQNADAEHFSARAVGLYPLPDVTGPKAPGPTGHVWLLGRPGAQGTDAAQSALQSAGAQVYLVPNAPKLFDASVAPADALVMVLDDLGPTDDPTAPCAKLFATARFLAQKDRLPTQLWVIARGGAGFGLLEPSSPPAQQLAQTAALTALSGMVKSLAKEWPQCVCRTIDVVATAGPTPPWDVCIAHSLALWGQDAKTAPREVVVHVAQDRVSHSTLTRHTGAKKGKLRPLPQQGRVVATGGARGVTYALLMALAQKRPLDITILARTQPLQPNESPVAHCSEEAAKQVAKEALATAGERVTPAAVRYWLSSLKERVNVWENLTALETLGCRVKMIPCNVGDLNARAEAIRAIQSDGKPVHLLLHGAGIEESKWIKDKDGEALARTLAPKAQALWHLQSQLAPQRTVTMGSIAGRFGNGGQTDYAAANEMMAGMARLHQTPMLNLAWTAWGDVGMATRGSVGQVLKDLGVTLMPQHVGVKLGADLIESDAVGDVVVAGDLGALRSPEPAWPALFAASELLAPQHPESDYGIRFTRTLDPRADRGLDDHRIDGVPLLPGVLGVEFMQQAAQCVLGRPVTQLTHVAFKAPIKLFFDRPQDIQVEVRCGAGHLSLAIFTERTAPSGQTQRKQHFTAQAPYTPSAAPPMPAPSVAFHAMGGVPPTLTRDAIYARYFHGPSFQVLKAAPAFNDFGIAAQGIAPTTPWLAHGAGEPFATLPWAREAGFQAAGLWEMAYRQRMGLPSAIASVWLGDKAEQDAELHVSIRPVSTDASGCTFDIYTQRCDGPHGAPGTVIDVMQGYRSIALRTLKKEECIPLGETPAYQRVLPDVFQAGLSLSDIEPLLAPAVEPSVALLLSAAERTHWATLTVRKRRLEWLAGRLVAKRLVRASWYLDGVAPSSDAISITADGAGAPKVDITGRILGPNVPLLSVSHGAGRAMAMVSWQPAHLPGVDVEEVAQRIPAFGTTYFTEAEQACAHADTEPSRILTAMWAVKEATGKALGLGTRLDYLSIETLPQGPVGPDHPTTWKLCATPRSAPMLADRSLGTAWVRVTFDGPTVLAEVVLAATESPNMLHPNGPHTAAPTKTRRLNEMNS